MKNLLHTHSIAWAQGVRITLEAEGIHAVILDEHDRGALGVPGRVRLAVLNDDDVAKAQAIVARLMPPRTGPPPSWRWQKRGLLLLAADFVLFAVWFGIVRRGSIGRDEVQACHLCLGRSRRDPVHWRRVAHHARSKSG